MSCTCEIKFLMDNGCQCGAFKRELKPKYLDSSVIIQSNAIYKSECPESIREQFYGIAQRAKNIKTSVFYGKPLDSCKEYIARIPTTSELEMHKDYQGYNYNKKVIIMSNQPISVVHCGKLIRLMFDFNDVAYIDGSFYGISLGFYLKDVKEI